jgi:hypothetical protein
MGGREGGREGGSEGGRKGGVQRKGICLTRYIFLRANTHRERAVLPDRALCLPTFSHFLIVNKSSPSLLVSLSRATILSLQGEPANIRKGRSRPYEYYESIEYYWINLLARESDKTGRGEGGSMGSARPRSSLSNIRRFREDLGLTLQLCACTHMQLQLRRGGGERGA